MQTFSFGLLNTTALQVTHVCFEIVPTQFLFGEQDVKDKPWEHSMYWDCIPTIPTVAALSAHHLAALTLPSTLAQLYIASDNDSEGLRAAERLADTARRQAIADSQLVPRLDDWNSDLLMYGVEEARRCLLRQL